MVQSNNCFGVSLGPPAFASLEPFQLHTEQQITLLDPIPKLQGKPSMCQSKLREHNNYGVVIPNRKRIFTALKVSIKGPFKPPAM